MITFLAADMDLNPAQLYLPGSRPTVRMRWRVRPDAPLGPSDIYFENDTLFPFSWNAMTDWHGSALWRPVKVNDASTIDCACGCHADPAGCNGVIDVTDIVMVTQIAVGNGEGIFDPGTFCPIMRTDVDCDGVTGIIDLVTFISVAFRNTDPTATFCNPCE